MRHDDAPRARIASLLTSAVVAGACLCSALPASAVEIFVARYHDRRVLAIEDEDPSKELPHGGMIMPGDAKRVEEALRTAGPVSEVLFNSRGGAEQDGLAIGRLIRKAGLSTRILKGMSCASACSDAFMGGVARRVDEGGRYGIHMATIANDAEVLDKIFVQMVEAYDTEKKTLDRSKVRDLVQLFEQLSAQSASRWGAYVLEMGGSARIVDVGTQSAATSINWLTRQQMIDLNVINVDD